MAIPLKRKLIAWILRWTGSCEKATALISQSLDKKLSAGNRISLAVHMWLCSYCKHYREQLRIIREITRANVEDIPPLPASGSSASLTPEARERIKKALRNLDADNGDRGERNAG